MTNFKILFLFYFVCKIKFLLSYNIRKKTYCDMAYKDLTDEQLTEAREAFKLVDKECSGRIKTKEVGIVLRALGHNPSEEDLERLLAGKEDSVTLNDFMEMLTVELNEDVNNEELRVAFMVFDREGQVQN